MAVTFDARKNLASSLVATAPSPANSGTTLSVTGGDGAKFPVAPFNAVVCPAGSQPTTANAEIVRVTNKGTGDNWTITRTQEGTSARSILVGDQIFQAPTDKSLLDIENVLTGVTAGAQLNTPTVTDSTDTTKQFGVDLTGVTTGIKGVLKFVFTTAKTLTFPDATDTLVGRATTDTLTNKTLTSPVITNPSTTGTDSGTETLQNKSIASGSNTITGLGANTMGGTATGALMTVNLNLNLTGTFANLVAIANNQIIQFVCLNNGVAQGGTYWGGWFAYNSNDGLQAIGVGGNITFQYSGGFVQWKSSNAQTYTLQSVIMPLY